MDYRICAATTAGGSDITREPALYAAGMQVDTLERGVINDGGDLQELLGMHQRDQGRDMRRTIIGRQGTGGGQQKGADQQVTKVNYGDKNRVSECVGGEQAAACLVGGVSEEGGGCYFCGRMLRTEEQTWDDQHNGI